jgi:hypothetical protein
MECHHFAVFQCGDTEVTDHRHPERPPSILRDDEQRRPIGQLRTQGKYPIHTPVETDMQRLPSEADQNNTQVNSCAFE